ncbi:hypothetical protein I6Y99_004345 [Vibrio parahaemolyticus]|nr:hypothetical protein [Vibrio parahaemolyticus]
MGDILKFSFNIRPASTEWTINYPRHIEPCPFCRQPGYLEVDCDETYYVACLNKACWVGPITKPFETKFEAVRAWNCRG